MKKIEWNKLSLAMFMDFSPFFSVSRQKKKVKIKYWEKLVTSFIDGPLCAQKTVLLFLWLKHLVACFESWAKLIVEIAFVLFD